MDNWEDENFIPAIPSREQTKNKWEDEDVDDEDVKESWEDEDSVPTAEPAPDQKTPLKVSVKSSAKKSKQSEKVPAEVKSEAVDEKLVDPVAEKLRQQRLVEESDFKATAELFGKKDDEKSLDNFIPKSESDFLEYAELLCHRIRPYEKSFHYIGLLRAVMRHAMVSLKASDAKEVSSCVSAIANEKLKAEKEANAGKKKGGAKKKQLHMDRDDDMTVGTYDDVGDDYDFM